MCVLPHFFNGKMASILSVLDVIFKKVKTHNTKNQRLKDELRPDLGGIPINNKADGLD